MNQNNFVGPVHFLSGGTDVHDQLKTFRLIIKAIFDSTKASIFLLDPNYKIIFLNKKAKDGCKRIYGKDANIGDNILDFRIQSDEVASNLFKKSFEEALHGTAIANEQKINFANTAAWVRMEYTPVYDHEKIAAVLVRYANIDERKDHELKIVRQSERLKKISWMQSHETRQPVASILGLINIFDKNSLTEENKEILALLEKTVEQLDKVIRSTVIQANSVEDNINGS